MIELIGLPYSPWSEKARFALEVRGIEYRAVSYSPLLGEPALRLKLRRFRGPVSVPVLHDGQGEHIADSAAIARWADQRGAGPRLFPAEHSSAITRFIELSERALAAGRGLSLVRMLADDEALAEMVPRPLRARLGRVGVKIAALGVERTRRKYGATRADQQAHERALTLALDELRAAVAASPASGPAKTLLDAFSFADIAASQALAFVSPPSFGLRLGRASRSSFTDPGFSERYADLVEWRDAIYEKFRPRKTA
ncbi:MAG: glutathione S-transferase [Myxococcales bacterium]|nr:glutathione S-transferase [Myxococcales bacterium]